jgi:hypothetical protein
MYFLSRQIIYEKAYFPDNSTGIPSRPDWPLKWLGFPARSREQLEFRRNRLNLNPRYVLAPGSIRMGKDLRFTI